MNRREALLAGLSALVAPALLNGAVVPTVDVPPTPPAADNPFAGLVFSCVEVTEEITGDWRTVVTAKAKIHGDFGDACRAFVGFVKQRVPRRGLGLKNVEFKEGYEFRGWHQFSITYEEVHRPA